VIAALLAPKALVLYTFAAAATFVHFRGQVRHGFWRQLTDHSTFMAPYNALVYLFSAVPNQPLQDLQRFPELKVLRDHWTVIRDEVLALQADGGIGVADGRNDLGFNSFFKTGWKRFYLKWYGEYLPSARERCPRTVALLERTPSVKAAMFALLAPGGRLPSHRDPFAGSLRYHLGLVTPNSSACRIRVDGTEYAWRDGEDLLFDETYIHTAENRTGQARIILFCDVERPLKTPVARAINRGFGRWVAAAAASRNLAGERLGALNHLFKYVYALRLLGKRMKAENQRLYYAFKYVLFGALVYWLVA
jgi:beta-hydroxylase